MFNENQAYPQAVAMVPELQPQMGMVDMGQQAPSYGYQGAELYSHDYNYGQYFQPQEEYLGASISELPQQDL